VWRAPDHREMRWKNGRGTTHEVATSPDGSDTTDFDWRISFADVDTDGPFSSFAGIDRVIVLVNGKQMVLTIDGRRYTLEPRQPLGFAGESCTTCHLPAGRTRDLNVMTRRGRILANVEVRTLAPEGVFAAGVADQLVLVALNGELAITSSDGEQSNLEPRDVLRSLGGATLTVTGPGTVAVVRLTTDPRAPSTQLTKTEEVK
jgi:environmental stress-induced protein Ves